MKPLVSLNYPLYGNFSLERLLLTLESITNQSYSSLEIIISEQNPSPRFKEEAEKRGLEYCFSEIVISKGKPFFSPAKIRNAGLALSKGKLICITDGDLILQRDFIKNLVALSVKDENSFFMKPAMRRLPEEEFEAFMQKTNNKGLKKCLDSLNFPDEYTASLSKRESELVVVRHGPRKIYTTSKEKFERYCNDVSYMGFDTRIWSDVIHYGSIFARKNQFVNVSGYSESLIHWGYEDVDMHWKLSSLYKPIEIPKTAEMEILHLDHPKSYFSKDIAEKNRMMHERRIALGIKEAIEADRRLNTTKL